MPDRPNVLLIFTDQQRHDTLHAISNPVIRTPNLDRICAEGTTFTSAYSSSPVCVSARCSLNYGQYPHATGCYDNGYPMPSDGRPSIMDALAGEGYRTHGIGKCHFSPDRYAMRGFQTREIQEENTGPERDDYMQWLTEQGFGHVFDPHGSRGEMYYVPQVSQLPARCHPTQWVGDRAVDFLSDDERSKEPWFLYSGFIHPHPPFSPPTPWDKLYRAPLMPLPKTPADFEELQVYINRRQNRYKYRDQGIDQNLLRCEKAFYYACISFIDYQVGRVLAVLEESGQLDNTLILYSSDHGEHLGDYHCFGKRSFHDSCARVPMLARLPGRFRAGEVCDLPASLVDVMPTALGAAGVDAGAANLDGVDLAELAEGKAERDGVFIEYAQGNKALYTAVTERWKYVYAASDNREFLFDRVNDPDETRNCAGVTFRHDDLTAMRKLLIDKVRDGGIEDALDGDGWRVFDHLPSISSDPDDGLLVQDAPHQAAVDAPGYVD